MVAACRFPNMISICEDMVKIICHASLLKVDDVRLKSVPLAAKCCVLCDHGSVEDAAHMVMPCPGLQPQRSAMFHEIDKILARNGLNQNDLAANVFLNLMGRPGQNIPIELMEEIWQSSARQISNMYRWKLKYGIG